MRPVRLRVGIVSTYPPRRDGFAEDAGELVRALSAEHDVAVCAVGRTGLNYPDEVVAVVATEELDDYQRAGQVLAEQGVDVVLIRHDDGIFGGVGGSHVLTLAQELRRQGIAVIVSLQTVRRDAGATWSRTVAALTAGATRVLVPTEAARDAALSRRVATADQLRVIPVGAPAGMLRVAGLAVSPTKGSDVANLLGEWAGGHLITTVGPDPAGPAFASTLAALARLVTARPTTRYAVLRPGNVVVDRDPAWAAVEALGLGEHVRFVDGHVLAPDLAALLARTRVYLAVDDGAAVTLGRAAAAGCPTVDATDLAVPLTDPELFAKALGAMLDDPTGRDQARRGAATASRRLCWPAIARRVAALFVDRSPGVAAMTVPPLVTTWLKAHALEPEQNARLAAVSAGLLGLPAGGLAPADWSVAASWARRAVRSLGTGAFADGGRAVWGLGVVATGRGVPESLRYRADVLRANRLSHLTNDTNPAVAADVVLGLVGTGSALTDGEWTALEQAAARLDDARRTATAGSAWPCFADRLRPGDIRLAHALIAGGRRLGNEELVGRGVESVDWIARRAGLGPVDGLYAPPEPGPRWSTTAGAHVEALVEAYRATGSSRFARMAQRAMGWFHGANPGADAVYDAQLGACRAGLGTAATLSALTLEATLAYLAAVIALSSAGLANLPAAEVSRHDLAAVA